MDYLSIAWTIASHAPVLAVGVAIGAYGYRYLLKRNPVALEALVQEVNTGLTAVEAAVSSVTAPAATATKTSTTTPA